MSVVMYKTPTCPYCIRAQQLLKIKGVTPQEIDITQDPSRLQEMLEKSGGKRTVPQIFIGDYHVGGSDELYALEKEGRLDDLLNGQN